MLCLLGCIFLSEAAGIIGGIVTAPAIPSWYAALTKPSFTPPGWVFGPAWTILYLLMGISLYLASNRARTEGSAGRIWAAYLVQWSLNVLWSVAFFGLRSPSAALAVLAGLWVSILWLASVSGKSSRAAVYLLVPYLAWVTFAGVLNLAILLLN